MSGVDGVAQSPRIASSRSSAKSMLVLDNVTVRFREIRALSNVSVASSAGSVVGIIGPNGSGKTTLLNVMSGFVRPSSGSVRFDGVSQRLRPSAMARRGVGRTFQQPMLVDSLSVIDNVRLSTDWLGGRGGSAGRAKSLLEVVGLDVAVWRLRAGEISYGQRRLVDLARALGSAERLLLLDEPTAGVSADEWKSIAQVSADLADRGVAVVVTDHNLEFMEAVCHTALFLHHGEALAEGSLSELLHQPEVIEAYTGASANSARLTHEPTEKSTEKSESDGLQIRDIRAGYGGRDIIRGVSLSVEPGQIVGVAGPNGAGKTTLLNAVTGVIPVRTGSVIVDSLDLTKMNTVRRAHCGLVVVAEGRQIFRNLTVEENLRAAYRGSTRELAGRLDFALGIFSDLEHKLRDLSATLSGGQQQMLVIARAMMMQPRVLLLDEPTLGLAPVLVDRLLDSIRKIAESGVGIVITDQDVYRLLSVANNCHILVGGSIVLGGASDDLRGQASEIEAVYLGGMPDTEEG